MGYENKFDISFMEHTLRIVEDYRGEYDATILINCLVGLLIVPKERYFKNLPQESVYDWGIQHGSIKKCNKGRDDVQYIVQRLRNAVAHFGISPYPENRNVKSFIFRDNHRGDDKFEAVLSLEEIRLFTRKIAEHISKESY